MTKLKTQKPQQIKLGPNWKINDWQNSRNQFVTILKNSNLDKTQNSNCEKTLKKWILTNSKTQIVTHSKIQMGTKFKNGSCDNTQKV